MLLAARLTAARDAIDDCNACLEASRAGAVGQFKQTLAASSIDKRVYLFLSPRHLSS